MGFATLDVWIHDIQDPCRISNQNWFVNVTDCSNRVVEWCGRRFAGIPAKCGHVEIVLPPGCYTVWGAVSVAILPPFLYANHITHFGMVNLSCDQRACVNLYAPTYHLCWRSILFSTQLLAQQKAIPREKAQRLIEALNAVAEHIPKTGGDAELDPLFAELPKMIEGKVEDEKQSK